jgi:hypothetical protein
MIRLSARVATPLAAIALALALPAATPAVAQPAHCPPGLAKKSPACVPPGLARTAWRAGDRIQPGTPIIILGSDDWSRYGLRRPAPGSQYVVVDSQLLRVAEASLLVLEAIRAVDRALN